VIVVMQWFSNFSTWGPAYSHKTEIYGHKTKSFLNSYFCNCNLEHFIFILPVSQNLLYSLYYSWIPVRASGW